MKEILSLMVSYQKNTWSEISDEVTIDSVLNEIKSNKYEIQINTLRNKLENGDKEFYDNFKKQLPAVTFSATFNLKRKNENLKIYNEIIVIDIDKLTKEQIELIYSQLKNDEYVLAFWRSPSNNGFKGLVAVEYEINEEIIELEILHKRAFKKLFEYFQTKYSIELDKSGSDLTRLCFMSFDSNIVIKTGHKRFKVVSSDIKNISKIENRKSVALKFFSSNDALFNHKDKNKPIDRKIMTDIIRNLTNKKQSITNSYEDWCKVAMAISNTFTYEIGLKYFLKLCCLDGEKYNEIICTNFLNNCFETRKGDVNFSSIIYLANQKGYKTKHQKNGVLKEKG
ncbi:BT4734/BF3469 family protein [Kaistella sp.]|uniref:BT4734/BF3469 family protein n=1 Tax=Kaistella sp. TaxID=2782235 RepID=UPI0035A0ED4F